MSSGSAVVLVFSSAKRANWLRAACSELPGTSFPSSPGSPFVCPQFDGSVLGVLLLESWDSEAGRRQLFPGSGAISAGGFAIAAIDNYWLCRSENALTGVMPRGFGRGIGPAAAGERKGELTGPAAEGASLAGAWAEPEPNTPRLARADSSHPRLYMRPMGAWWNLHTSLEGCAEPAGHEGAACRSSENRPRPAISIGSGNTGQWSGASQPGQAPGLPKCTSQPRPPNLVKN